FDPVLRNLYLPCIGGDHVTLVTGHVNPGQRTGLHFNQLAAPTSPGGSVGDLFANAAVDLAGNVYAAWVDANDHNVYVSGSSDGGHTWTAPLQVNGDPANTNVWPWIVGGAAGTVDLVWYGTAVRGDPGSFPSWFSDRIAATAVPWDVYLAQVRLNFTAPGSSPIYQVRATEHPMHFGQICQEGLGCTTSNGDRSMADFFSVTVDASGAAQIVYDDTTNQHHGASLFVARQVAGPGVFGSTISRPVPHNPVSDPKGDAQAPHYAPVRGPGPNVPSMDLTAAELSQPNADTLRVRMRVANAASPISHIGLPKAGDTLYSVTAFTFGEVSGNPLFLDVDATAAFDVILSVGHGHGGHKGDGHGTVTDDSGNEARFSIFANDDQIGKVAFVDPTMGLVFQSAFIGSAVFDGTTATIEGTGFIAGAFGQFRIVLQDLANPGLGKDTFSIELSTGVKISGTITSGEIAIS